MTDEPKIVDRWHIQRLLNSPYTSTEMRSILESHEALRKMVDGLAERVALQSELLSKRAEK